MVPAASVNMEVCAVPQGSGTAEQVETGTETKRDAEDGADVEMGESMEMGDTEMPPESVDTDGLAERDAEDLRWRHCSWCNKRRALFMGEASANESCMLHVACCMLHVAC